MTIKQRFKFFIYYTLPHFFNKYFTKYKISERGQEFLNFCMKVVENSEYEAETYQEIVFEKAFESIEAVTRREAALYYIRVLLPYIDFTEEK